MTEPHEFKGRCCHLMAGVLCNELQDHPIHKPAEAQTEQLCYCGESTVGHPQHVGFMCVKQPSASPDATKENPIKVLAKLLEEARVIPVINGVPIYPQQSHHEQAVKDVRSVFDSTKGLHFFDIAVEQQKLVLQLQQKLAAERHMHEVTLGLLRDERGALQRAGERIAELEQERKELINALRSRCVCDSKGYYDFDVAKWFDPDGTDYDESKNVY